MIVVRPEDVYHKTQLLRLLTEIADDNLLSSNLYFKGGTAASMLGFLDRFSVNLDFDLAPKLKTAKLRRGFAQIFAKIGFAVNQQNKKTLTFLVKYPSPDGRRNTIKVSALPPAARANCYAPQFLPEIDRTLVCQTIETMFANKLVAPLDRYKKYRTIAGRDFYDIHHFFFMGYRYDPEVIRERTGLKKKAFLGKLVRFIDKKVSQRMIDEDLSMLLATETFSKIRKTLKTELLAILASQGPALRS